MVHGVSNVWLPVEDMERAVAFYRDTLGLEIAKQDEQWTEFDANGLRIGLNGRESAQSSEGGAVITFQPDGDLEEQVAELQGKGVTFTGGISEYPWGRLAPFKDSEGNDLQLYAPPAD